MSYLDGVWQRLQSPGVVLLLLGAAAAYGAGKIAMRVPEAKREKLTLTLKAAGGILAVIGALTVFEFI